MLTLLAVCVQVRLCETLASIAAELKTHLTMHNHSETVAYEEQRTKELNEFQKEVVAGTRAHAHTHTHTHTHTHEDTHMH